MSPASNRYQVTIEADPKVPIVRMTRSTHGGCGLDSLCTFILEI